MIEMLEKLEAPLHPLLAIDLILGALPAEYGQIVVNFYMNKLDMTLAELLKFLTTAEESLGRGKAKPVLMVEDGALEKRGGSRPPAGKRGKGSKNPKLSSSLSAQKPKARVQKKKKVAVVYYHCGKKGHWRRNCAKLMAERKAGKQPVTSESA
ncbi:unnamed protein product [Cuscuta campestris]|uniref:CCHC-type domain-containing protein n=1 Tax=Cuscuta campestris TaxID=132261 RepID=A0A484NER2_9ASTE|nr:unnamed protein product [Cuscuta campestris]